MSEEIESESVSGSGFGNPTFINAALPGSITGFPSSNASQFDIASRKAQGITGARINSFALVSYLPDPLAAFLNELRHHFAADCMARAHITVLPPRPLAMDPTHVWPATKTLLQDFGPFPMELGEVELFPATRVIYVAVKTGFTELVAMHDRLNAGATAFAEPFNYHPHITLAQDLHPSAVEAAFAFAQQRWRESCLSRHITIDRLTFVQNNLDNRWTDLDSVDLSTNAVR